MNSEPKPGPMGPNIERKPSYHFDLSNDRRVFDRSASPKERLSACAFVLTGEGQRGIRLAISVVCDESEAPAARTVFADRLVQMGESGFLDLNRLVEECPPLKGALTGDFHLGLAVPARFDRALIEQALDQGNLALDRTQTSKSRIDAALAVARDDVGRGRSLMISLASDEREEPSFLVALGEVIFELFDLELFTQFDLREHADGLFED